MLEQCYCEISVEQGVDILRAVIKLYPAANALITSYSCWLLCEILLMDYTTDNK